jgi:hypothetical protein
MPKQTALSTILALLPSLNLKDRARLRKALDSSELSPCERLGHAFKQAQIKHEVLGWFNHKETLIMVCSRCGLEKQL